MIPYNFGPNVTKDGVEFRLWAPKQAAMGLKVDGSDSRAMQAQGDGWFQLHVPEAGIGSRYSFVLEDGLEVPDPASRFQPDDVHKPSEVIDPNAYPWQSTAWKGRPWHEMAIYEMHLGAFTPEGSFRAAAEKLPYLRDLGITAIQLMPVNDFHGKRGWGYDGVLPYAPDSSYGRPEDLKAFIDAAHGLGLSVFLDVIYNHFGPEGNYMPLYAPLFTEKHKSPWGAGINYDAEGSDYVRTFVIENVLYWIEEFRVDGLRFDAVHAIKDDSEEHLLHEIARRARAAAKDRELHLILENEDNSAALLERGDDRKPRYFTAQWNDDIHHVLHYAASGEDFGYYADYAHDPSKLGRALSEGFVYQGETMPYRGSERGEPSADLPPMAFISFIQNHDQVGNRAYGDRLSETASPEAMRAVSAVYLLAPQIPMLFMGEEFSASTPFPYFCDFPEQLNDIVRKGRREELARLPGFDEESAAHTPDPTKEETFLSAKLDWAQTRQGDHARMLEHYRDLLRLRHDEIVPRLSGIGGRSGHFDRPDDLLRVIWRLADGSRLTLTANLSDKPVETALAPPSTPLWTQGAIEGGKASAWYVSWSFG